MSAGSADALPPGGDRRQGDRRRSARPAPPPDSAALEDSRAAESDSRFEALWRREATTAAGDLRSGLGGADSALGRIYRTYAGARAALGVALVLVQAATSLLGVRASLPLVLVCLGYAVQAVSLWLLPRFNPLHEPQPLDAPAQRRRQWLATIGVDLLAFLGLHALESGNSFNYVALLVLPVLMAGVLTSRLLALGTAALVAIALLLVALQSGGAADNVLPLAQSGLAGMGLFLITLLSGELASRLAREELAARGSLELARQQALLNRLMIEEMADGVLVVDAQLRVRAANPAARSLLWAQGLGPSAPFQLQAEAAWEGLRSAVAEALAHHDWPAGGSEVSLRFASGELRQLRLRVRFTRRSGLRDDAHSEDLCVLLLEDARNAQARLQQEKLAAMGRVSAGVAHEIRNPLAAILQANALLLEDALVPAQQQLARIVADNAQRLKRIVDEVMELAPGAAPALRLIDAHAEVADSVAAWARTAGVALGEGSRLRLELPGHRLDAVFDTEHLRRVLVNLLDNAARHASARSGAIGVRLAVRDAASAVLVVDSDGEAIAPEVERYLFEPFFSTRSRGTGLGLYICRELCERHGASIEYRQRSAVERNPNLNMFLVVLRRELPDAARAAEDSA